ncbi:hypothetical protein Btru_001556 [Bulinus truncatus]|nr:hypothetical protein Btru_001556 [Bulinus truncatus]
MTTIVIFGVLFHIPTYMAYEYKYIWRNATQSYQQKFERNEFGESSFYNEAFFKWISMTANFLIPFILLLAVNVSLLRSLRLSKSLPEVQNRAHPEYRLTIMVFCMTAIFFLFELLEASSFILTAGIVTYDQSSRSVMRFTSFVDLLIEINSAVNFIIYCTTGRKFRDMFRRVFLPCLKQQHVPAVAVLTLKNMRAPAAKSKMWTSWEFLASNIRCYQIRPSDGSISSSSTKSSKTSSLSRYNSQPNLKNNV